MRSSVRWSLLLTLVLTGAALWWPRGDAVRPVVAAADRLPPPVASPAPAGDATREPALPQVSAEHAAIDKPRFDPFVGVVPPAPSAPPPPKPLVGPVFVPAPAAPPLNYRYLGRMVDPAGKPLVYLARADKDVPVSVGAQLDEGYVVEAITADAVRLVYPPLRAVVLIPIPPASNSPVAP